MPLQFEVDSVEGLDDAVKSLYVEKDGKFRLDVSGIDPADELKEALRKEREVSKSRQAKLEELDAARAKREKEAEAEKQKILEEAARKSGDFDSLRASYEEKFEKSKGEYESKVKSLDSQLEKLLVDNKALDIATQIAPDNVALMLPHVKARIGTRVDDDGQKHTAFMDKNGNLSSLTADDLVKEFMEDKTFAAVVTGSRATGGGATGGGRGGASKTIKRSEFERLDPASQMKFASGGGEVVD